jgi:YegS/Rv2252/BmrU family lipid kinase
MMADQTNGAKKVFIVMNPVSGVKDTGNSRKTIEDFCQSQGWAYEIYETKPDDDLRGQVRKQLKQKVDYVLAAGGDGTVAAVVNGLVNSQVPLGILPLGTGNNLARDLSIPLALPDALALLASEKQVLQNMDVFQVGETYYVMNVSIGVSADTMEKTGREEKKKFGMLAYLRRGIESINQADLYRFLADVDGRKVHFRASEVMITNDKFMGLQPRLEGVEVEANDGALDMFIVRASSLVDYLGVFRRFLIPANQKDEEQLKHLPVRTSVIIQSDRPLRVQADGEVIGQTPVEIHVVPDALRVVVPPAANKRSS